MNIDSRRISQKIVETCPICDAQQSFGVQILRHNDGVLLAYLTCGACNARVLARMDFINGSVVGTAVVTDLERDEVERLYQTNISRSYRYISPNDVLDIVDYFNNSQTNKLLQQIYG